MYAAKVLTSALWKPASVTVHAISLQAKIACFKLHDIMSRNTCRKTETGMTVTLPRT